MLSQGLLEQGLVAPGAQVWDELVACMRLYPVGHPRGVLCSERYDPCWVFMSCIMTTLLRPSLSSTPFCTVFWLPYLCCTGCAWCFPIWPYFPTGVQLILTPSGIHWRKTREHPFSFPHVGVWEETKVAQERKEAMKTHTLTACTVGILCNCSQI